MPGTRPFTVLPGTILYILRSNALRGECENETFKPPFIEGSGMFRPGRSTNLVKYLCIEIFQYVSSKKTIGPTGLVFRLHSS